MYIDPTEALIHKAMPFDERHGFLIFHDSRRWQLPKQLQNLGAPAEGTTCQFADDKRVTLNFGALQKRNQPDVAPAQMLHPDRGVDQYQRPSAAGRRRRIFRRRVSLPPKAASLLALSRAIKASSPACTTAVFSVIPVSCAACLSKVSLILSVVLICISMHV